MAVVVSRRECSRVKRETERVKILFYSQVLISLHIAKVAIV